jgi:predicted RNA-binding Zn-ribbon protein involved in translation (DUF1610 family)
VFGSLIAGDIADDADRDGGDEAMSPKRPIFAFLRSRGARIECPFCGKKDWEGWDERISLDHVHGSVAVDRRAQAFPLMCRNCGFIRLQAAHVLDDPRTASRNDISEPPRPMRAVPESTEAGDAPDALG